MSRRAEKRATAEVRRYRREDKLADKKTIQSMAARITELESALKLHHAMGEADRKSGDCLLWTPEYEEACEVTANALRGVCLR